MKSRASNGEASPVKSLAEELDSFRATVNHTIAAHLMRLESDIVQIKELVLAEGQTSKLPQSKIRDLRDMLTLLRTFDVDPVKGRRKDVKRVDALLDDLRDFVEKW
jgi:hypothetical protein